MSPKLILASGSAIRASILTNAGVRFEQVTPGVDEAAIKTIGKQENLGLEAIAMGLAEAKALDVDDGENPYIIGSDQILEYRGQAFDKAQTMSEARERLRLLQGDEHRLINAVAVVQNKKVVWRHIDQPRLVMRPMTDTAIDAYLTQAGEEALSSVGAYQVEKLGVRLFERIEGDYFAVLGLSLFPLLTYLRQINMLEY